jgi:hypothetical protein
MARENEFVIIQKTYDLVKWCCDHTSRFPRNHRFSLGARIESRLYILLETLIQARYTRERRALLLEIGDGIPGAARRTRRIAVSARDISARGG